MLDSFAFPILIEAGMWSSTCWTSVDNVSGMLLAFRSKSSEKRDSPSSCIDISSDDVTVSFVVSIPCVRVLSSVGSSFLRLEVLRKATELGLQELLDLVWWYNIPSLFFQAPPHSSHMKGLSDSSEPPLDEN